MKKTLFHATIVALFTLFCVDSQAQQRGYYDAPYTRYEADKGTLGGGATVQSSYAQDQITFEASDRTSVLANNGGSVTWNNVTGNFNRVGITLRFAIADGATNRDGDITRTVDLSINGTYITTVTLHSQWSWEHLWDNGNYNNDGITNYNYRMRFDEQRIRVDKSYNGPITIKLESKGSGVYFDFIEVEDVPEPIACPTGYSAYSGNGNNLQDFADSHALLYIPEGTYNIGRTLELNADDKRLRGAGPWYTTINFTSKTSNQGGLWSNFDASASDFSLTTSQSSRSNAYKGINGSWGKTSVIENVFVDHFECGAWIANYNPGWGNNTANGLTIRHCRLRNNYADGVNFCKGSANCKAEHCSFRNNGDDDMAVWPADGQQCHDNTFQYNTAEFCYRASSCALYGGYGNKWQYIVVKDNYEVGIRISSTFAGACFADGTANEMNNIDVIGCGTWNSIYGLVEGAVEITQSSYACGGIVKNVKLSCIDIKNSNSDAFQFRNENGSQINNVKIDGITIDGTSKRGYTNNSGWGNAAGFRFVDNPNLNNCTRGSYNTGNTGTIKISNMEGEAIVAYGSKWNNMSESIWATCVTEEKIEAKVSPTTLTICAGEKIELTGSQTGASSPKYTWKFSATGNYASATKVGEGEKLEINNATTANAGTYYFLVESNGYSDYAEAKVTVNALPTVPTLSTNSGCDNNIIFTISNYDNAATYAWTVSATGTENADKFTVTSPTEGTAYTAKVKVTKNSCSAESAQASQTYIVTPNKPTLSVSADNCGVIPVFTITDYDNNNSYAWEINGSSVTATTSYTVPNPIGGTAYSATVTATRNGCTSSKSDTKSRTYKAAPEKPTISVTPGCDQPVKFTITNYDSQSTYSWKVNDGLVSASGNSYTVSNPVVRTNYIASVTANKLGCDSEEGSAQQKYVVTPTIAFDAQPACTADKKQYTATVTVSAGTVTSTAGTVTLDGTNHWLLTADAGTNATLTVTNDECTNTLAVTAPSCGCPTINAPVSNGDKTYCAGTTIPTLSVKDAETGYRIDWYDAGSEGTKVGTSSSYTPTADKTATYYAEMVEIVSGCTSTRTAVKVTRNELPTPTASNNGPKCEGETITLSVENFASYAWTGPEGFTSTQQNPTTQKGGEYSVTVTDANGCKNTASTTVTTNPVPVISKDAAPITTLALDVNENATLSPSVAGGTWNVTETSIAEISANVVTGKKAGSTTATYTANGCSTVITITVTETGTSSFVLTTGNNEQTICAGSAIGNIEYAASNVSAVTVTGLPAGVTYNFADNKLTISGTPTATGISNFTVTPTAMYGTITPLSGSITINAVPTISETSKACDDPNTTYHATVSVSAGTVTTDYGTPTDKGSNIWDITNIATGQNIVATVTANTCTAQLTITAPECGETKPIEMGKDVTKSGMCGNDEVTLNGSAKNVTKVYWTNYDGTKGEEIDCSATGEYSGTFIYQYNPPFQTDDEMIQYVTLTGVNAAGETAVQTFTIQRWFVVFGMTSNGSLTCKGESDLKITLNNTGVRSASQNYLINDGYGIWTKYDALTGDIFPTDHILYTDKVGKRKITVSGDDDPTTAPHRYCGQNLEFVYEVANVEIKESATWPTSVVENGTLSLGVQTVSSETYIPEGYSVTYQWEKSTDGGTTWSNVGGNSKNYSEKFTESACYRVSAEITDGVNPLCNASFVQSRCIEITQIEKGADKTFYVCPGDEITLEGYAKNITSATWSEASFNPATISGGICTSNKTYTVPTDFATEKVITLSFEDAMGNKAQQVFTIKPIEKYAFTLEGDNIVCKNDNTVTIEPESSQTIAQNTVYYKNATPTTDFTLNASVAGENAVTYTAEALGTGNKNDNPETTGRYCISESVTFNYDVVDLVADKADTWHDWIFEGETMNMSVTTNGSVFADGVTAKYKWEKKSSSESSWTEMESKTESISDSPTKTTEYQVTVSLQDANGKTYCQEKKLSQTVEVISIKMGKDKTDNGVCPGDPFDKKEFIAENVTSVYWIKDFHNGKDVEISAEIPVAGEKGGTYNETYSYVIPSTSEWDGTYNLTITLVGKNAGGEKRQTLTITPYEFYTYDIIADTIACKDYTDKHIRIASDHSRASTASYFIGNIATVSKEQLVFIDGKYSTPEFVLPTNKIGKLVVHIGGDDDPTTAPHRICGTNKDFYYEVMAVEIDQDSKWPTTIYENEPFTLNTKINENKTYIAKDFDIVYQWEKSTDNGTTWNVVGGNTPSFSEANGITADACYRATANITDGKTILCTPSVEEVCVKVYNLRVAGADTTISYCPGSNVQMTVHAENLTGYAWTQDVSIAEQNHQNTPRATLDNTKTLNNVQEDQTWYFIAWLKNDNIENKKIKTYTIKKGQNYPVSIQSASDVYACQNSNAKLYASTLVGAKNEQYTWNAIGSQGVANGNIYTLNTTSTGDTQISVTATADGYCPTTSDVVTAHVLNLTASIATEQNYICTDSDNGVGASTVITLTINDLSGLQQQIDWYKNDIKIANENSESITVNSTGNYKAVVTTKDAQNNIVCEEISNILKIADVKLGVGKKQLVDPICAGQNISFEGRADYADENTTFNWKDENGKDWGNNKKLELPIQTATSPNEQTTYTFTATKGVCVASQDFVVTVRPYVDFDINDNGITAVCKDNKENKIISIENSVPSNATYSWTINGKEMGTGTFFKLPATVVKAGQKVIVTGSANGYCDTESDKNAKYQFTYDVSDFTWNLSSPTTYCPGDQIDLEVTVEEKGTQGGNFTYIWYENGKEVGNNNTLRIYPKGDSEYFVKMSNGICNYQSENKNVREVKVGASSTENFSVCPGYEAVLTVTPVDATSKITWTKTDATGTTTKGGGKKITDNPTSDAVYTATLTNKGCTNKIEIEVKMYPVPVIDTVVTLENPKMIEILASAGTSPYDYAIDNNSPSDYQTGAIFNNVAIGHHTVYVKDLNSCKTSHEFTTIPLPIDFPLYFTPNDDGLNDVWHPSNIDIYDKVNLIIFDRYGKKIFETTNPAESWDGTYLGKKLPSTDYWYILDIEEIGKHYTGHFTLVN